MNKTILTVDLGRIDYRSAWELQHRVFALRQEANIGDVLLFCEHPPVYTFGRNSDEAHLLADEKVLRRKGAEVFHVERGGDVTFHGPGQIVGYPILDLRKHHEDLHRYLRDLEEVIIRTVREFGIAGSRDEDFTGVWSGGEKIAAIGVKVRRWVTMHGFALNVNTDLSWFDEIIPCGIFHKGVTSLRELTGRELDCGEAKEILARHVAEVFQAHRAGMTADEFFDYLGTLETENNQWRYVEHQPLA